jgi:sugar lactone lactonase YvrE
MKSLDPGRYALSSCVAAAMLAGCGGSPPAGALGVVPQMQTSRMMSDRNAHRNAKWFLYVGFQNARSLDVYRLHGSEPIREYPGTLGPVTIALDPWNDVYTTDNNPSGGAITAYTPGARSVLFQIGPYDWCRGLAFDAEGNLYAGCYAGVREFAARSRKLIRLIRQPGVNEALAFDSKGNLYVAGLEGSGPRAQVEVFPPGAKKPARTITEGIQYPFALLVDKSNDLFVANCGFGSCYLSSGNRGSITEYAYGSGAPLRTITDGIDSPQAMAFGKNGLLFVANYGYFKKGSVTVYSSGTKPVRRITAGIRNPDALAVGPSGYVYVANYAYAKGHDSITVYTPDGSQLVRTIPEELDGPLSLGIGKE